MHWAEAPERLNQLPSCTPQVGTRKAPHPVDALACAYASVPIQSPADAAAAITLGLAALGIDVEDDGAGECLLRNVLAYLRA